MNNIIKILIVVSTVLLIALSLFVAYIELNFYAIASLLLSICIIPLNIIVYKSLEN